MTKNNKTKRIKVEKYRSDEQEEIIRFVKILIIVIILVLIVYFFTRLFVTKDLLKKDNDTPVAGNIDYNTTLIGNMFNKKEDNYYIILFNSENLRSIYYNNLVNNYSKNEEALNVYYVDLKNGLNAKYVTEKEEEIKVNTTNFEEFKVGELALLKISNKTIIKAYTTEEQIAKELEYKQNK